MPNNKMEKEQQIWKMEGKTVVVTGANRGYLFCINNAGESELRVSHNSPPNTGSEVMFSRNIVERVRNTGRTVLTVNAAHQESFNRFESVSANDMKSMLCVPIMRRGAIFGVCYLDNSITCGVFDGTDREMLEALMAQAAVSIDRFVKGRDLKLGREAELKTITNPQKEVYNRIDPVQMPRLDAQQRVTNFDEVQLGLTEEMVIQEAKRCINCGSCCVQACPYGVMQFNHDIIKAVKCDLCVEKRGRDEAPACSLVCPTHCIVWGNPDKFPEKITAGPQPKC